MQGGSKVSSEVEDSKEGQRGREEIERRNEIVCKIKRKQQEKGGEELKGNVCVRPKERRMRKGWQRK